MSKRLNMRFLRRSPIHEKSGREAGLIHRSQRLTRRLDIERCANRGWPPTSQVTLRDGPGFAARCRCRSRADDAERLAGRDDVHRARELCDEPVAAERLVLGYQVALDMVWQEF